MKGKNAKKKELFLELFWETGGNIALTCKEVGISRQTYYNWLKKDKKFAKAIEETMEAIIDFAENKLLELVKQKNLGAIIFFLCNKGAVRGWRNPNKVEISGQIDVPRIVIEPAEEGDKNGEKQEN